MEIHRWILVFTHKNAVANGFSGARSFWTNTWCSSATPGWSARRRSDLLYKRENAIPKRKKSLILFICIIKMYTYYYILSIISDWLFRVLKICKWASTMNMTFPAVNTPQFYPGGMCWNSLCFEQEKCCNSMTWIYSGWCVQGCSSQIVNPLVTLVESSLQDAKWIWKSLVCISSLIIIIISYLSLIFYLHVHGR